VRTAFWTPWAIRRSPDLALADIVDDGIRTAGWLFPRAQQLRDPDRPHDAVPVINDPNEDVAGEERFSPDPADGFDDGQVDLELLALEVEQSGLLALRLCSRDCPIACHTGAPNH
jgi:hypothetical protein